MWKLAKRGYLVKFCVRFVTARNAPVKCPSVIKWFAALLTEEMEKTSVIAKKPAAASVHLSRRIGVPSLSSNAGVISAPTVTPQIQVNAEPICCLQTVSQNS